MKARRSVRFAPTAVTKEHAPRSATCIAFGCQTRDSVINAVTEKLERLVPNNASGAPLRTPQAQSPNLGKNSAPTSTDDICLWQAAVLTTTSRPFKDAYFFSRAHLLSESGRNASSAGIADNSL